jgi:hypothetical protein
MFSVEWNIIKSDRANLLKNRKIKVKKNIAAFFIISSSILTLGLSTPAKSQVVKNTVGPALLIGNGSTSIGVDARFGLSDTLAARPFIFFPSGGTLFGSSLTYEFEPSRLSKFQMNPYLGGGVAIGAATNGGSSSTIIFFTGGADFELNQNIDLKASLNIPLTSNNSSTDVRLGAGFRF